MLLMDSPAISRRAVIVADAGDGASPHLGVGSRLAGKVLQAVDLGRRTTAVLRRGRWSTVLLQDAAVTYSLAPWSTWRYEFTLLRAVIRPATGREGWGHPAVLHDLHACASTDLPDHYEAALAVAAGGDPVVITRWGVPISVLEPAAARDRDARLVEHRRNTVRLLTLKAIASTCAVPVHEWLPVSPYPWLAVLPHEGIEEFTAEIVSTLADAVRTGDPGLMGATLSAWRSACETRADDELVGALKSSVRVLYPFPEPR